MVALRNAHLLVELPTGRLRLPLDRDVTSIGSDPGCSLAFQGSDLAPHHCIVQRTSVGYEVFDLVTEVGVLLNGRRVEAAQLISGDQLQLGGLRLAFLESDPPVPRLEASRVEPTLTVAAANDVGFVGWEELRASAEARADLRSDEDLLAAAVSRPFLAEIPAPPRRKSEPRRWLSSVGQRWQDWRARRAVSEVPVPPILTRRTSTRSFSDELLSAVRASPYYAISLVVHALLLVLLSQMKERRPVDREVPPVQAGLVADASELPFADLPIEEDESIPIPAEPTEAAPDADAEVELEPLDPTDLDPMDAGEDASDAPVEVGPFLGGGVDLGEGRRGLGGGTLDVGEGQFGRYVQGLRESGLDIVFVIDSTGSMGDVLQRTRADITRMIDVLTALVPGTRLGMVTYRDRASRGERGDYVTLELELTTNSYEVVSFLDSISAGGGGDVPEAAMAGLLDAFDQPWRRGARRVVILVGDAPGHAQDWNKTESTIRSFTRAHGVVHALLTPVSGGMDEDAAKYFRSVARVGQGAFAGLGEETILERVLELAFGKEHASSLREALTQLESGPDVLRTRRLLSSDASPRTKLRRLRGHRIDTTLLRELAAQPKPEYLSEYVDIILDARLDDGNRWAAAALLRRALESLGANGLLRELAKRLIPSAKPAILERDAGAFTKMARAAGLIS